jgi:hypothetical protein
MEYLSLGTSRIVTCSTMVCLIEIEIPGENGFQSDCWDIIEQKVCPHRRGLVQSPHLGSSEKEEAAFLSARLPIGDIIKSFLFFDKRL